ncbi:hypothetical protein Srufu_059840 [Streptomyces libani subsp. rufus]|nr:hypothetical protein Srufu_059840 [Streptomyces libani subsp. rufus]
MSADRPTLPPVRLHSEAELARDALSAPLMARAAKLARWAEPGVPVGVGGQILEEPLAAATEHLGLAGDEDGPAYTAEAWQLAVDTGLVEITETEESEDGADLPDDAVAGIATPGEELGLLTSGSPQDILDIWLGGMETVLADAAAPDLADLADQLTQGGELDLDALDWNPEEEAELLDGILGNLYLLTALNERPDQEVPLPALAASMIVPDDMDEPTDDVLEEVSEAMMRLDDQFRVLEPIGLVAYQPVDEALIEELDEDGETALPQKPRGTSDEPLTDEDVSRYGLVRLTPSVSTPYAPGCWTRASTPPRSATSPTRAPMSSWTRCPTTPRRSPRPSPSSGSPPVRPWTPPGTCSPPPAGTTSAPRGAGSPPSRPSRWSRRMPRRRCARCSTTGSSAAWPGSGSPSARCPASPSRPRS